MITSKLLGPLILMGLLMAAARPLQADDDVVMKAMRDEMARSTTLHLPDLEKPYFVAERIQDLDEVMIGATLGSIAIDNSSRSRLLHIDLRVGDYKLDNTNFLSVASFGRRGFNSARQITTDNDYKEIRRQIWLATDSEYKSAAEQFVAKKSALQNQTQGEELADFSHEKPNQHFEKQTTSSVDTNALKAVAREASAVFRQISDLDTSTVIIDVRNVYTRYLNNEGTEFTRSSQKLTVNLKASMRAKDGIPLDDSEQLFFDSASDLSTAALVSQAQRIVDRMQKLRTATTLDRYNGPVLFEDTAGAEVFAQLFAPGLVASRNPATDNPQAQAFFEQLSSRFGGGSLVDKLGGRVLPDYVDISDDPQMQSFQGTKLLGTFSIDDDGLPSRSSHLVEHGILKSLLASRIPTSATSQSTGSHRGFATTPSNMLFSTTKSLPNAELRRMLLEHAKARGYDYGIVVRRSGGSINEFIQMAMSMAQGGGPGGSTLLEVYKVYADGREELVHGTQLPSTSTLAFKDIVAVGDKPTVYSTYFIPGFTSLMMLGLSGDFSSVMDMPVTSYVVPSLLFDDVTLKKVSGPFPNPPLSPPPALSGS